MDRIDAMILREILWNPSDPHHAARGPRRPWDVARDLGLHGTTVKRRLEDLRASGFLKGIHLVPAPSIVARRGSEHVLRYEDGSARRRAFEHLRHDASVWTAYSFVGREILVNTSTPEGGDVHAAARRLAEETGAVSSRFHHLVGWDVPVERVSALDLRILAAYAEDAHRPVSEAASEVGVAAKTVTSRMRALAAHRAFVVHPIMDYSCLETGMATFFDLQIGVGNTDRVHVEVPNRFPLALCRSARGAETGYVVVAVGNATEVDDALARAESIPGVDRVDAYTLHETHGEPARWKDALLARAEALARAKGVWAPSWRAKPSALRAPVAGHAEVPSIVAAR